MIRISATLISILIISSSLFAQTIGELTVATTTSSAGGNYAPKNIVAIWVEDASGSFVKTLLAYAQNRKTHLNTWEASTSAAGSIYNTVDAITGPTKTNHTTRTCYWDGTNTIGINVADGDYKICMELTDKNSTGNYTSFTFTKGPDAEMITPFNVPSFGSITIAWDPIPTNIIDKSNIDYTFSPNPTNGKIIIAGNDIRTIEVYNLVGNIIRSSISKEIDISMEPKGVYIIKIKTASTTITNKVILR